MSITLKNDSNSQNNFIQGYPLKSLPNEDDFTSAIKATPEDLQKTAEKTATILVQEDIFNLAPTYPVLTGSLKRTEVEAPVGETKEIDPELLKLARDYVEGELKIIQEARSPNKEDFERRRLFEKENENLTHNEKTERKSQKTRAVKAAWEELLTKNETTFSEKEKNYVKSQIQALSPVSNRKDAKKSEKNEAADSSILNDPKFKALCQELVKEKFLVKKNQRAGLPSQKIGSYIEKERDLLSEKDSSLSTLEKGKRKIARYTVLKSVWKEFGEEKNHSEEDLKMINQEIAICDKAISGKNNTVQKPELVSLTLNKTVPSYSPHKFKCVANELKIETEAPKSSQEVEKSAQPTYKRAKKETRNQQEWFQKYSKGKELKRYLKEKIKTKIEMDLKKHKPSENSKEEEIKTDTSNDYNFAHHKASDLLNKLSSSNVLEVITETTALIDPLHAKLPKDEKIKDFYAIFAFSVPKARDFFKDKPGCASSTISPLYKFDPKNSKKINPVPELENQLRAYLTELSTYLEKAASDQKNQKSQVEKKEVKTTKSADLIEGFASMDDVVENVSHYFLKLLKQHKILSHQRFVDLFTVHKNFLNRLSFALSLIGSSEIETIKKVVGEAFNPKILLLDTEKHRNTMGTHKRPDSTDADPNYKKAHAFETKFHVAIDILTQSNQMISDTTNFKLYEAAHVVPYPALFARRDQDHLPREQWPSFSFESVSEKYWSSDEKTRDELFKKDLLALSKHYKDNPEKFLNEAMEIVMKVSLEESSHTVHLPGFFNQFIDGASEKYVQFLPGIHDSLNLQRKQLPEQLKQKVVKTEIKDDKENKENSAETKKASQKSKAKKETKEPEARQEIKYTEKAYKYILANDMNSMVQEQLAGKEQSKKIEYSQADILKKEQDYLQAVKLSIANQLNQITEKPPTITSLIMACSLCNVFYAIKNAEGLADEEKPLDLKDGEAELLQSFMKVEGWAAKS